MGRTHKNEKVLGLIATLKRSALENEAPIWKDVAKRLEKPKSSWAEVNLSHLERTAANGDVILVPGALLGAGSVSKKLTVASVSCSEGARAGITGSGGKVPSIEQLIAKNPSGKGIRIIG